MKDYKEALADLETSGSLRQLPEVEHQGKYIRKGEQTMLNLSSNDYLGLSTRRDLRDTFLDWLKGTDLPMSSTSSRLLTGNYAICNALETDMATRFGRSACLLFNSGWHANTGILPALADKRTLILADRLVHASIIDGIRLSGAPFRRFAHNNYEELERLLAREAAHYEQVIIATESIFSMDGDVADLTRLVSLKKQYANVMLYVDEAHAIGVRGATGLGVAEEQDCLREIDLLVGTFGKALASMGAYLLCSPTIRQYLVNTMRPLIFSTALPPAQVAWTKYLFDLLPSLTPERERLQAVSLHLRQRLQGMGGEMSASHIVPWIVGDNDACLQKAEELQRKSFYCLPVRPPTVPKGTSRLRFSLTANITLEEISAL